MAVTLTSVVTYPTPGVVPITVGVTGGGNFARLWCTNAPDGTLWREQLDTGVASRVEVFAGSPGTWSPELTVGGAYTFQAQEYTKGATAYGGGYELAPDANPSETKVGAENTLTFYVGQRLVCRLGAPGYGFADLVIWVWNDTVRATTLELVHEVTPAIVSPTTDKATTATKNATVVADVAALVGRTSSQLIGALDTLCAEMKTDIPLHFNNSVATTYHGLAGAGVPDVDNDTAIEQLSSAPATPAGYVAFFNTIRDRLQKHYTNSLALYHNVAATGPAPDWTNALLSPLPAGADMSQVLMAAGDLVRSYNAHILDVTHHTNADVTNGLATVLGDLAGLHRDFLSAMRVLSPAAPTTHNPGATALIHGAGFTIRPL